MSIRVDSLTVLTQNVIPDLTYYPEENSITIDAAGASTVPGVTWSISNKTVTWNAVAASYDLEVGDSVVVSYEYDPSTERNGGTIQRNSLREPKTITIENRVPPLAHIPYGGILEISVNSVPTNGVGWSLQDNIVTWDEEVSGYNLDIGDELICTYDHY